MPASQDSEGSAGHGPAEPLHSGQSSSSEPDASDAEPTAAHDDSPQTAETATEPAPPAEGLDEHTGDEAAAGGDEPAQRPTSRPAGADWWFRQARRHFRRWRRSRPFWGALIALLGGAEIALSERLPLAIVVHLGAQGIAGLLVPIVLMLCAVLLWFNPTQRLFYSILAVLSALGSFITSNLGGFVLGGLLGIVGGSLAFAWVPDNERRRDEDREDETGPERGPSEGLALLLGDRDPEAESEGPSAAGSTLHAVPVPVGLAMLAPVLHPLLTTVLASLGFLVPAVTVNASMLTTSGPNTTVDLISPSPSPSPSPITSPSPSPTSSATPSPSPSPTASPMSAAPSQPPLPRRIWKQAAASALAVSQAKSSLTAGSAHLEGLSYDGVASVPTASGGSVDMLKFSMSSMTLAGGTKLTVTEGGITSVTSSPSLAFTGNVLLYTTKISGDLLGIPFTYTPDSPPPLLLPDIDFSNVETERPFAIVGGLAADGVRVSVS